MKQPRAQREDPRRLLLHPLFWCQIKYFQLFQTYSLWFSKKLIHLKPQPAVTDVFTYSASSITLMCQALEMDVYRFFFLR